MQAKWIYSKLEQVPSDFMEYVQDEVFAQLLLSRGVNSVDKAKQFLEPEKNYEEISPYAFSGMRNVVERISKAIATDEKILIYGDFDADGVTSTSLIYKALKYLGANVEFYVPDRMQEGHGLNAAALIKLKSQLKMGLVITVDCGISNLKEVKLAGGFGVDVIITDHHEAGIELPQAYAIINPKAQGALVDSLSASQVESLNYLAGVGVVYKVAQALLEKYGKPEFERELLPFVAIGTIADVVPLREENRLLVCRGVECIKSVQPLGIKALMDVAGYDVEGFDAQSIAFGIAPRINAIGRLEHASKVVELLTTQNVQQAEIIAKYMNDCNKIRQGICENIYEQAVEKIDKECDLKKNKAIILTDDDWHIGVIGIVASKICESHYRPVIIIRVDEESQKLRCSARGILGLNLYEVFDEVSDVLEIYGGHALAAGFSTDKKHLDSLVERLHQVVNESLDDEFLTPIIKVDKALEVEDLSLDFVNKLGLLEPCGEKNPAPLFSLKNLVIKDFKTMGSNSNHLKVFFANNLEGVLWGQSEIDANIGENVDVVFAPQINTFRDKSTVQLVLKDYKSESRNKSKIAKKTCAKFVDHTKKDNALEMFFSYLKTTKTQVSIFAEQKQTLAMLSDKNIAQTSIVGRLEVQPVDQLVFLDYPPDRHVFHSVLSKAEPKVVHLIGRKVLARQAEDVLKTFCGMLKYAHSNLEGQFDLNMLASKLYLPLNCAQVGVILLERAGIIEVVNVNNSDYEVKFLQSKNLTNIKSFEEYRAFESQLESVGVFDFEQII